jgi:ATP-dependent exoDNAse (exonuclease V) beta subunit
LGGLTIDAESLHYGDGQRTWCGSVVTDVTDVPASEPVAPPEFETVAASARVDAEILRRVAPAPPVAPLFRRSATELMVFAKDRDEHRRSYLLGLRPPPRVANASAEGRGLDARTTGDVVHAIMELDADVVARDVDAILDRELASRLGEESAASLPVEARERLRRLVERTHAHPAVARLVKGDAVERELSFTWFLDVDGHVSVLHGAMDLVARVDGALEILDFKTHRLKPGEEAAAGADYDLQRDLYAAALDALAGAPAAFSLLFPETSHEVRTTLQQGAVVESCERVRAALRAVRDA